MKIKTAVGFAAVIVLALFSCKKSPASTLNKNASPEKDSVIARDTIIAGKWNLITDSTFTGVGYTNHPLNYTSLPGDYFDFRTNGTLYTKEGTALDTLSYEVTSDTTMIIAAFGITFNGNAAVSHLVDLTAHSVTITAPIAITPAGEFGRKVMLSR